MMPAYNLFIFVSAPFELLTQAKNPMYSAYFVEQALADQNVGFIAVQFALPVCAAVTVFQYLYKVNSTSAVHAMPFSRSIFSVFTLYISGMLSTASTFEICLSNFYVDIYFKPNAFIKSYIRLIISVLSRIVY